MRVLIACEFSGIVRNAFTAYGHRCMSCDLVPTEQLGWHYQGDVIDVLYQNWDLMIAHPPCTYLTVSGARWMIDNKERQQKQKEALRFIKMLYSAPIPRIAIENPVGAAIRVLGPATQIIQPWQFGHPENKRTCLWLKNLPPLTPTHIIKENVNNSVYSMPDRKSRQKDRSRTFTGIAYAMAQQWNF